MQRSKEKKDGSASHRRSPSARASAKRKHGGEAQGASQQQKGEKQQPQDKVECPLCGSSIALFAINAHMDFACTRRPRRESRDGSGSAAASPEGPAAAAKKAKGRDAVTSPGTAATAAEATVATASAGPSAAAAPPAAPAQSGATKPHQLEHLPEAAAAPPAEAAATPTPTPKMKPVPATQRTGTVHDFFGGQDHTVPGFFVLDTAAQPWRASFERRRPAGAKTVVSTKWMGKDLLLLYAGETSPVATDVSSAVPTHSACYTGQVPLLKSHLQVRWSRVRVGRKGRMARAARPHTHLGVPAFPLLAEMRPSLSDAPGGAVCAGARKPVVLRSGPTPAHHYDRGRLPPGLGVWFAWAPRARPFLSAPPFSMLFAAVAGYSLIPMPPLSASDVDMVYGGPFQR